MDTTNRTDPQKALRDWAQITAIGQPSESYLPRGYESGGGVAEGRTDYSTLNHIKVELFFGIPGHRKRWRGLALKVHWWFGHLTQPEAVELRELNRVFGLWWSEHGLEKPPKIEVVE